MDEKLKKVIEEVKEKTKKECYVFKRTFDEPLITDSKVGGNPYLPEGEELPKSSKGEYMPLFIQINLDNVNIENFPNKGLLQLFADKDVDWPTDFKFRYYEDYSKPSQTEFPEIDRKYFFVQEEIKIELEKQETFISINDYRFSDLFCEAANKHFDIDISYWMDIEDEDDLDVDLDDIFEAFPHDNGNIGGYPDFTQTDPRDGDLDEEYTECLFKLDSCLDSRIQIGDSGIAWALMTKEDLVNKNFDNARFDWDCC
ncbi:MAG: DUF1963 domain-containing protein [Clostridia bacterium]|nr:DUF1963 domain-containing protein [Clostridia bacterium]